MYSSVNCDCYGTCIDVTRHSWKHIASKGYRQEYKGDNIYKRGANEGSSQASESKIFRVHIYQTVLYPN